MMAVGLLCESWKIALWFLSAGPGTLEDCAVMPVGLLWDSWKIAL